MRSDPAVTLKRDSLNRDFRRKGLRTGSKWEVSVVAALLASLRFLPLPSTPRFQICGFHWLTGRPCPLCGMTRALSAMMRGRWGDAVHFNVLSPLALAVLAGMLVFGLLDLFGWDGGRRFIPLTARKQFWPACVLLILGYGVLRFFAIAP